MDRKSVIGPWKQGLYDISAAATEIVGTIREDVQGNKYRYAKAGSTGLSASLQTVAVAEDADWVSEAASAHSVGDRTLTLTIKAPGATGVNNEDYFAGGQIVMQDGTAEGIRYPILYSSAVAAAGTSITITIDQPLVEAITSGTEFTLVHSPYMATVISATATDQATGVPLVDVTAAYYYWSQTGGEGIAFGMDTTAVGQELTLGTDDGSLSSWLGSFIILSGATPAVSTAQPSMALVSGMAMVSGEFTPVRYTID